MPRFLFRRTEAQRWYRREQQPRGWWTKRRVNEFVDYFRLQGGTLPEMMVYAELVRRNVPFAYAKYLGDIPFTTETERYRPDFTLEDYRIIIRVQGMYWHTRPGDAETDAMQAALLLMLGWKVYDLWETDILKDVRGTIDRTIPELVNPAITGVPEPTMGRPFNALAGFLARIRKAPKVQRKKYRRVGVVAREKERDWFPRRKHAPWMPAYVPIRFKGWKEEPEKWPGAEDWWAARDKALTSTTWADYSAAFEGGMQGLSREFNNFPVTEPEGDVSKPQLTDPWGAVQERIMELVEAGR